MENCLEILEMLGALTPEQEKAKIVVKNYLKVPKKRKAIKLEAFVKAKELGFQELIQKFMDQSRLKRAKRIKDKELTIEEFTDGELKALIRDYHVVIDFQNRVILHDCADWSRCLPIKRFCKHIGKLILSLPEDRAVEILRKIFEEREVWEFKPYLASS